MAGHILVLRTCAFRRIKIITVTSCKSQVDRAPEVIARVRKHLFSLLSFSSSTRLGSKRNSPKHNCSMFSLLSFSSLPRRLNPISFHPIQMSSLRYFPPIFSYFLFLHSPYLPSPPLFAPRLASVFFISPCFAAALLPTCVGVDSKTLPRQSFEKMAPWERPQRWGDGGGGDGLTIPGGMWSTMKDNRDNRDDRGRRFCRSSVTRVSILVYVITDRMDA